MTAHAERMSTRAEGPSARVERLVEQLPDAGVDVMLVTGLANVRYLTGYTGSNGIALIGAETAEFVTDFRYVEQAAQEIDPLFNRRQAPQDLFDAIESLLPDDQVRLGFEDAHVTVRQHARLRELLPDRIELLPVTGLVESLREVKGPEEVARIRAATELADNALRSLLEDGLLGRTERELALSLELKMRERGARGAAFETIVAGGAQGALPHARPSAQPISGGELVVIDWGAELDGYCSDCTRTVSPGEPGEQARAVYQLVLEAQLAGVQAVRAGAGGKEVDSTARAMIEAAGHGEHFGHGLGHGVGLEVHESPRLSRRSDDVLRAGNVVTVEPGIYLPGRFGVRIEDLVVVSEHGCEILTSVTKELIVTD